jgi:UDP-galactopyranose mutase
MQPQFSIVAFSHLRWNFVYQRPQHLLSRLAATRPVFFVEEPELDREGPVRWERSSPQPNVVVLRPRTPVESPGFNPEQLAALEPLISELAVELSGTALLAWFYTPLALPLARILAPDAVVYDCMDELSLFLGAPPELLGREAELIQAADVMFTGGPSLFRAKRSRHRNVHCFPSSVDAAHFRAARAGEAAGVLEADDQARLPHPRLGFYGVIDERLDIPLIDFIAQERPEWHVVLVGPVVKIDPAMLPQRPNIHYFGQRSYDDLAGYLVGWDVCLLPFALNDATRFISPTKTLEYMAAERPIVSTPITDVAEPYGEVVYLGRTPQEFLEACDAALEAGAGERARRAARMREVLAGTSWDVTVAAMEKLIAEAMAKKATIAA